MQVDNILKSKRPAVLWVSPAMTIGEVAERLRSTDVGAMIVSNDGEALHGLISERDIAQGLAVHGAALLSLKVQDLMTRSVISCSPEDNTADIARIMTMRRIRHIPVVENGRVVGVISIGDVLKSRISEIELEANVLRAIPVQVGGLYPISDVWYIEPALDVPDRLRVHIAQFACEIAEEAAVAGYIEPRDAGIGFVCAPRPVTQAKALSAFACAVLTLLQALSSTAAPSTGLDRARLADDLAPLLHGSGGASMRLSDAGLVKLFRLLRLARRLLDLESGAASVDPGHDS